MLRLHVDIDRGSVVPPVVDLLSDVDHVFSADASPSGGVEEALCNTLVLCGKWHGMATPRVHLVCIVPLYSTHVLLSR